jgi:hypothetical protein
MSQTVYQRDGTQYYTQLIREAQPSRQDDSHYHQSQSDCLDQQKSGWRKMNSSKSEEVRGITFAAVILLKDVEKISDREQQGPMSC